MGLKNERYLWIDSLRGLAMIMVVYGHCVREWTGFFVFTSPIKMPLFFIISGYLFKSRNGNDILFFKSVFQKLILPWMVLGMISFTNPVDRFLDLISGNKLWFMPCLIIGEVIWFYNLKFSKSDIQMVSLGMGICGIGFLFHYLNIFRYAMFDTACIIQFFFIIGNIVRKHKNSIFNLRWGIISIFIVLYLILAVLTLEYYPGEAIDVHLNSYYNIPICIIMIISGCLCLFSIFRQKNVSPRWLVYIGQNTLVIYILHGYGFTFYEKMSSFLGFNWNNALFPLEALFKTIISVVICCILAWLSNHYCPVIVGKSGKNGDLIISNKRQK